MVWVLMELRFMVLGLRVRGQGWAIFGEELLLQQGGVVQLCLGPSRHRHRQHPCPSARKTGALGSLLVPPRNVFPGLPCSAGLQFPALCWIFKIVIYLEKEKASDRKPG